MMPDRDYPHANIYGRTANISHRRINGATLYCIVMGLLALLGMALEGLK